MRRLFLGGGIVLAVALGVWISRQGVGKEKPASEKKEATKISDVSEIKPGKIAPFVNKGIEWLIAAQHNDGGWGGGSHANQKIRDPHKVATDPATTAFTALAILRAGHTPTSGSYHEVMRRATEYLVDVVEKAKQEGPLITNIQGTQPQTKLGRNIDTAMTAQYLARILPAFPKNDKLGARVDKALNKCLHKIQVSQQKDGSWGRGGGWAPVLQSALSCNALEIAQGNGKKIDQTVLNKARDYQNGNIDAAGRAKAADGAGVELYSFSGGQRANASGARFAAEAIQKAKQEGKLAKHAEANVDNLVKAGIKKQQAPKLAKAVRQNLAQVRRLDDEALLKGFGNNGGEEYLSYLMTSESLVIASADKFHQWNDKMHGRLKKVQNGDGSWSGHHCITSPVFCTAAVVQCLTTDQDANTLIVIAKRSAEAGLAAADTKKAAKAAN